MKKNQKIKYLIYGILILFLCTLSYLPAYATTMFSLTTDLLGDPRPENPDNLIVHVTIDATDNVAIWTIDLDSLSHPDIKLDEFYFNVAGDSDDYTFSNFSPTDWVINSPGDVQGGGAGGATFLFESYDNTGAPKQDVTNDVLLTFTMTKNIGDFVETDFTNAPYTKLTTEIGWAQLGAHLQSLKQDVAAGETTDSGFAIGTYPDAPPFVPPPVPEPGTMILLGFGLISVAGIGRRKIKK